MNRLAREASPYLQQHAQNPVDWYPWGPEALERARREDKPILLSVGYSACHWCHVMEKESFEDEATAALMNAHFVNIKVDREERPDLDQVYQLVVQLMGQGGGWPLTVFLTPDKKPFFGGTYFPPNDKYGRPGFPRVLRALAQAYREQREDVALQSEELTRAITKATALAARAPGAALGPELLALAAARLGAGFDDVHGGFGRAPKFPNTMVLEVLLRRAVAEGDAEAGRRVRHALDAMEKGGIWDHLGGGFHRYSTDEEWLVPHFEKILYDNALLLRLYVDGWRAFGEARYAKTARAIAEWMAREMTDAGGGLYASQDADSQGEEGKFFVWTPGEVQAALAGDDAAIAAALAHFGITAHGNFEKTGTTVLSAVAESVDAAALERARAKLFAVRERRPKPFRDEKILASWCALAVGALAEAGAALGEAGLVERAQRAFAFLEEKLFVPEGDALRVLRHAKGGAVKGPGFLDDAAFVACAALDLYEATGAPRYVDVAGRVVRGAVRHFLDTSLENGFFFAPDDGEPLLVRAKDPFDHAIPSGASMIALAMLRLEALRGDDAAPAKGALERMAGAAVEHPFGMSQTVNVLHRLVAGTVDVVIAGPRADARTLALARAAHAAPLLSRTIAWLDPSDPESASACRALAEGKPARDVPAAYVCRGETCSLPITDPSALAALLAAR